MRVTAHLAVAIAIIASAVTAAPAIPIEETDPTTWEFCNMPNHDPDVCAEVDADHEVPQFKSWIFDFLTEFRRRSASLQPQDLDDQDTRVLPELTPEPEVNGNKRAGNQTPGEPDPTTAFCKDPENKAYPVCEESAKGKAPDTPGSKKSLDPRYIVRMDENRILRIICENPANQKYPGCKELAAGKN
ncbi:hypothetical protein E2P81_ATG09986 [Venturia nashicola]|uniref:Uncharacterized protein n=1 Tax=Venturia nashicola TaxID=86259 RepID=A0A4Z1NQZ8_9PEZI|nr:hypothetical protein E6O75_ATG10207 [Venturia nashicola]TLD14805.1 hypothetical protein E2P81_ATG09986 [Venturia nashicola]